MTKTSPLGVGLVVTFSKSCGVVSSEKSISLAFGPCSHITTGLKGRCVPLLEREGDAAAKFGPLAIRGCAAKGTGSMRQRRLGGRNECRDFGGSYQGE